MKGYAGWTLNGIVRLHLYYRSKRAKRKFSLPKIVVIPVSSLLP
jgi:hypothetical protein